MTIEQGENVELPQLIADSLANHARKKREESMRNKGAIAVVSSLVTATIDGVDAYIKQNKPGLSALEADKMIARTHTAGIISLIGVSSNGNGAVGSKGIIIADHIIKEKTQYDNVEARLENVRSSDSFKTNGESRNIHPDSITNAEIHITASSLASDELKPTRSWLKKDQEPGPHFTINSSQRPKIVEPGSFAGATHSMLNAMDSFNLNNGLYTYEFVNTHAPSVADKIAQASLEDSSLGKIDIVPYLSPWIQEALAA